MKITDGILQAVKQEFQKQFPHAEVRILTPAKGSYDDNSKSGIAVYLDAKQDTGARTDNPFYGSEDCFLYSLDGLYGSWKRNLAHRFLDNPTLTGLVVSLDTLTIINERSRNWLTRFYSLDGSATAGYLTQADLEALATRYFWIMKPEFTAPAGRPCIHLNADTADFRKFKRFDDGLHAICRGAGRDHQQDHICQESEGGRPVNHC